jgi:hypothetical protein
VTEAVPSASKGVVPSFDLLALAGDDTRQSFLDVIDWGVREIVRAGSS